MAGTEACGDERRKASGEGFACVRGAMQHPIVHVTTALVCLRRPGYRLMLSRNQKVAPAQAWGNVRFWSFVTSWSIGYECRRQGPRMSPYIPHCPSTTFLHDRVMCLSHIILPKCKLINLKNPPLLVTQYPRNRATANPSMQNSIASFPYPT